MATGLDLAGLIQAAQLGRSLNPEVMQQQALGNQLAQQLQQLQIAKLIRDQQDFNNPGAANMRALQATLAGKVNDPLSGVVPLTPTEVEIIQEQGSLPVAGALTPTQQAGLLASPTVDETGFPVLTPTPRATLQDAITGLVGPTGVQTGFGRDLNRIRQGALEQRNIENIINPPKPTAYAAGSYVATPEQLASGTGFVVPERGVAPKPFSLSKGERLYDATGALIAENPSDAPRPLTVPSGGVILNNDGTVKFRNDKPDASASSEQYQFERIDRIKDSIDRIKQNVRSGTTGRSASLQSGTLFPKFAQTRGYVKLREDLESLKANIFTKELQAMRASSKTGGAIGNVSNLEGTRLSNALVALNQELDAPDLIANLDIAYDSIEKYRKELEKQGGSPTANQTVEMTAPDGRLLQVPADKVDEAISRGAKRGR